MMAGLVVLCMALFVFSRGSGSNGPAGMEGGTATVATWTGGSINQQELASLVRQRLITNEVLMRLFREGGGQTGYDFPQQRIPSFFLQSTRGFGLEQEVVSTEVIADLAAQSGVKISDKAINDYLKEVGLRNVDTAGIQAIMASVGTGSERQTEAIVFATLRKLLAVYYYQPVYFFQQGYGIASYIVTPQQRWEDWRKVNERISLQAAVLPVEDFLKEVKDPTDSQLQALYNDFKENEPRQLMNAGGQVLESPSPGFREPRRVRLQYILGSVADVAAKLEGEITEEQIKDYYERNKRTQFVKEDLFDEEDSDDNDANEAGDAEEAAPAAEVPAPDAPADESDAAEPATEDSSSITSRSPFQFVALQAGDASPSAEAAGDLEGVEIEAPAEGAHAAADTSSDGEASSDDSAAEDKGADETPAEFEPLDKVRDEIRKQLATDKAVQQLERTMGSLAAQLQTDFNRFASSVAQAKELGRKLPNPSEKLANFKPLAEKAGLTFERTALLTGRELSETAVGKAADIQVRRSLLQAMLTDLDLFEPLLARDLNGDWYLASKIEDVPSRVPPFDEVKEAVKAAWKHREAAKLAEKKAQDLAAEAEKSDQPFAEYFKSRGFNVIPQTEYFSWRHYPTGNPGQGSPTLSEIPELTSIGPDFMDAVFKLDGNQTIGLLNFDNTNAYIVRLNSRQYANEELRKLFLEEANTWLGQFDMRNEHAYEYAAAALKETLDERAALKWDEEWLARRQKELAQGEQ